MIERSIEVERSDHVIEEAKRNAESVHTKEKVLCFRREEEKEEESTLAQGGRSPIFISRRNEASDR